jgi:hypothetical protein
MALLIKIQDYLELGLIFIKSYSKEFYSGILIFQHGTKKTSQKNEVHKSGSKNYVKVCK